MNKKRSGITAVHAGSRSVSRRRDDRIRTCGILLPKQAPYRAGLHPVNHLILSEFPLLGKYVVCYTFSCRVRRKCSGTWQTDIKHTSAESS